MYVDVEVEWALIASDDDPLWSWRRVLYAWTHPESHEIVYIGKADYRSVRQRFACPAKDGVWSHLSRCYGIDEVDVRVGEIFTEARLTPQLLDDVESLLIYHLRPCCNVSCTSNRIQRPGLRVTCTADWPISRARFVDH